ncbi:CCR4-NOT transcription complex subunit 2-like [Oncorhynchus nerka]|uniref:CCR4-NOT transcription complex subunit 2-like n=1 Tax=Oncorhynchus nerka TaxID=8023 RepID=UPI0031B84AE4
MITFVLQKSVPPSFASPWASAPWRPQDIGRILPSQSALETSMFHLEYLLNIHIRDKLAAIKLSRYGEDLLFYLYYMNGGDLLQLLAAVELFNRDWRYHKEERVWITRAPGMEPTLKTNAYERGTYYFFDCLNWRKVAKVKDRGLRTVTVVTVHSESIQTP